MKNLLATAFIAVIIIAILTFGVSLNANGNLYGIISNAYAATLPGTVTHIPIGPSIIRVLPTATPTPTGVATLRVSLTPVISTIPHVSLTPITPTPSTGPIVSAVPHVSLNPSIGPIVTIPGFHPSFIPGLNASDPNSTSPGTSGDNQTSGQTVVGGTVVPGSGSAGANSTTDLNNTLDANVTVTVPPLAQHSSPTAPATEVKSAPGFGGVLVIVSLVSAMYLVSRKSE